MAILVGCFVTIVVQSSSVVVSVLRVTVALLEPPFSDMEARSMSSVSVGTSSSVTSILSVPSRKPVNEVVMFGVCVPSTIASSTEVTLNVAEA